MTEMEACSFDENENVKMFMQGVNDLARALKVPPESAIAVFGNIAGMVIRFHEKSIPREKGRAVMLDIFTQNLDLAARGKNGTTH